MDISHNFSTKSAMGVHAGVELQDGDLSLHYNLKRNREQVIQEIFGIPSQFVEAAEAAVQERMANYCNSG
ncbi:MAG: hypothetical protein ACE5I1_06045 [bacterium]